MAFLGIEVHRQFVLRALTIHYEVTGRRMFGLIVRHEKLFCNYQMVALPRDTNE